jgi:2-polyprenyl-3-methyl-5-hydroxy-6-metoxy-1,4-benzoquinol methylase
MERVKKFWNDRPCNIRHSTAAVGTREYFDQVEKRKYFVEPHIPDFADFSKWSGKSVLEIGSGIGTDTMNFFREGALLTSIDVSEESVKIAKQRAHPCMDLILNEFLFKMQKTFILMKNLT